MFTSASDIELYGWKEGWDLMSSVLNPQKDAKVLGTVMGAGACYVFLYYRWEPEGLLSTHLLGFSQLGVVVSLNMT